MSEQYKELVVHRFHGKRFDDHGIDLDVLPELLAFKALLVETAKELWRAAHPDRQRLPKNFEDSLRLKFFEVVDGSAGVPIMREVPVADPQELPFPKNDRDELDDAVDLIVETTDAAVQGKPLPERLPKNVIPLFRNYGSTLRDDESVEFVRPQKGPGPKYTPKVREHLLQYVTGDYEDKVDLVGEVRAADLDGCNFTVRLDDGSKLAGKFDPAQEVMVTEALREHSSERLRIKGQALFDGTSRQVKKIQVVSLVSIEPVGAKEFDETAPPIWQVAVSIGEAIPREEWERIPKDSSKNLDRYLYGHKKD